MTLNEYQDKAMATCMPSCENPLYMAFNLVGEVGELTGKLAKLIRKGYLTFSDNQMVIDGEHLQEVTDTMNELEKELGDVMWQTAGLAKVMGWRLERVGQHNLDKLASRKERGVIDGNGDNR